MLLDGREADMEDRLLTLKFWWLRQALEWRWGTVAFAVGLILGAVLW
jgi:hypothetical protein